MMTVVAHKPIPLVSDVMGAPVLTVPKTANAHEAWDLMRANSVQHLVVVDEHRRVVGVLSDGDLRSAQPSVVLLPDQRMREKALSLVQVADIMTRHPQVVTANLPVTAALEKMLESKVASIPVVDHVGHAVGIVTGYDVVLLALRLLSGDART